MTFRRILLFILIAVILTACSSSPTETNPPPLPANNSGSMSVQPANPAVSQPDTAVQPSDPASNQPELSIATGWSVETMADEQGQVEFEITPVNLNSSGEDLIFEVAMNTHSVDLGMDLAQVATLATDTGITVTATKWDAPRGGHHVSGYLNFPASMDGEHILEEATQLILSIQNVDAPERVFTWNLTQ